MKKVTIFSLLLALLLTILLVPVVVSADDNTQGTPGITVSNAGIVNMVSPGQVFTQTMNVSISPNTPATTVTVDIDGVAQSNNGTYILLDAADDTNPDTARPFITVNKSSFYLQPGGSEALVAAISIPQDASLGGYFAVIHISNPPVAESGSNIAISTAVNVPVYLTIKDSQLTKTGKIRWIVPGTITNGQPVAITTTFLNTGNIYFKIEGETTVTNDQGVVLGDMPITLTGSSVLPNMSRDMEADFLPSGSLSPGTYILNSKIMLSDGTVLDQLSSTFTVQKPYVPPPALGTVNLAPMNGISTLKNSDGTISISFPAGAGAIPVTISLNNYTAAQLPVAPTGFTLTGNCFQVNGLTGLLAKDATVTIKYTADDLSKAGGKVSSLKLLRWDPGTNQWVVLKTKVDTKAMTLSGSSKQMGIWAVAVSTVKSSGINWMIIGIPIAVVIIIGVVGTLLITRRKRKVKPAKR